MNLLHMDKPVGNEITPVGYNPPGSYELDLEIFQVSVLRRRVSADYMRTLQRIEFHLMIYVAKGSCTHMVDFESVTCHQGSLLMLQPGQVLQYGTTTDWQGWLLIFRPEFLLPRETTRLVTELKLFSYLEESPVHLTLNKNEQQAILESIVRMFHDTQLKANTGVKHMLLQNQLHALLIRIHLIRAESAQAEHAPPVLLRRFNRYRVAVEQDFHRRHKVIDYAKRLGCSEKSLHRAVVEVSGMSAKAFLSKRITLEAKRLLAHTGLPVSLIADKLGFDEVTNFIKFFRRESGCSPGGFRRQHVGLLNKL